MTLVPWEATGEGTKQTSLDILDHPCRIVGLTMNWVMELSL